MPHVHTQPGQHDLTASALVFRTDGPEPRVLFHWHKKLQVWMPFGGHVELHETPWSGIVHELREESGYDLDQLKLLQPPHTMREFGDTSVAHPLPFVFGTHPYDGKMAHYHTDVGFLFVTTKDPLHAVAEAESANLQLFTRAELTALPDAEILQNVRTSALYAFDSLLDDWQAVDPTAYSQRSPALIGLHAEGAAE